MVFSPSRARSDVCGTYYEFAAKLDVNLGRIRRKVSSGKYEFSPYLKKSIRIGHKDRDIYLASWPDRIVERWLACGLNKNLIDWFSPSCYAYRPGKFGLDLCQERVAKACKQNMYVIKRDISNYFYSIPHEKLIQTISKLIPTSDRLFDLILQRIRFKHSDGVANIGVPFGSPIACVLANIYLSDLDKTMERLPIKYFRYADDFIIIAYDCEVAHAANTIFSENISELGLTTKESHTKNIVISDNYIEDEVFKRNSKFKFLGLEFVDGNTVRLGRDKQRKIINLFHKELKTIRSKLKKMDITDRLQMVVDVANGVISNRMRSAAIIDYYLKHANDIQQLKSMDLLIAQIVISAILNKPFRYKDFSTISFKKLRQAGLISLVHRHRLHKQGHLHVNFLNIHNELVARRHQDAINRKNTRIEQMAMLRKLKKIT